MRNRLAILVLLGTAACSARSVRPPDRDGGRGTGVVKYQVSNVRGIDADRRLDAHAKMRAACDGSYWIVSERTRADRVVVSGGGRRRRDAHVQPVAYHYIEYVCASGAHPR
jgi:hypothetical protein